MKSKMTGDELRAKLKALDMNQSDLARRLGMTFGAVNRMVNSHNQVPNYVPASLEMLREIKELRAVVAALARAPDLLNRREA
jgi:transcriptional regulator with XRE-family HTH domain